MRLYAHDRPHEARVAPATLGAGHRQAVHPILNGQDVPHRACGWPVASDTFHQAGSMGRRAMRGRRRNAQPASWALHRARKRARTHGSDLRSGTHGAPNARAETRWPATGPSPTAPQRAEASAPLSGARSGHGIYLGAPRSRNAAAQPDRVKREKSAGRINAAAVYAEANLDGAAMAASRGGDHAPVSVELARRSWRDRTDDCGCRS